MCGCACVQPKAGRPDVVFYHTLPIALRQSSSMSWKLVISARQDGQQAMEICLSPCPLGKTMQFLVNCQINHCITGVKGKQSHLGSSQCFFNWQKSNQQSKDIGFSSKKLCRKSWHEQLKKMLEMFLPGATDSTAQDRQQPH